MSRPDFAFKTPTHTYYPTGNEGGYRAEPGGERISLGLEGQRVPGSLLERHLERAIKAWVIARGGRQLNLNGRSRPLAVRSLDRPAPGAVRRVVSLAPSNSEIVGALGAADRLVGVDSGSDFPPSLNRLPRLGPELHVDMDALAALRPDLVLAALSVPGMERNVAALDALGLPMLVLAPLSLAEIEADVLHVGGALALDDQARRVVAGMEERLRALEAERGDRPPLRVFLQWWHQPMFSPGKRCWSTELIARAGGINVFGDLPVQSRQVSPREVVAADPELIFLSWCGVPLEKLNVERVLRQKALAGVTAVRERRIYPLDEALLGRPAPRVVEGIARMARHIRGERDRGDAARRTPAPRR